MIRNILWSLLLVPFCAFADGDVDGGGGGTTNPDPVPEYEIVGLIQHHAKKDLRLFLKSELRDYDENNTHALHKKLFGGPRTILDVLEETDIDVRMDGPCYDKFGREVDGSIYSQYANSICISVHRIAPKLIAERMRVETLALILHELAHLLGATEQEAQSFQRWSAYSLRHVSSSHVEEMVLRLHESSRLLADQIGRLRAALKTGDQKKLREHIRETNLKSYELFNAVTDRPHSAYDKKEYDFFNYNFEKLRIGLMVAETLDSDEDTYPRQRLNELFGDKSEITYEEFARKDSMIGEPIFVSLLLKRSANVADLDKELEAVEKYLETQEDYFFRLRYDNPLRRFQDPTAAVVNPWARFVGNYKVVNAECKLDGYQSVRYDRVTKIEIGRTQEAGKPDSFWMRDHWDSASSTDSLDENRMDMGGYIQVDFLEQGARKRSGLRSFWNDRSSTVTVTMTELENQQFTLDVALRGKDWSAYGRSDYKADCRLTLVK